jgi:GTP-binding protein EngB required for normal cell division
MPTQKDNETGIAKLLSDFARQKEEYELTKVKCGFVGRSGVGKSSLINAITGEKLAAVGFAKETTVEPHEYLHRGLVLVDLPGCGTERFPTKDYIKRLNLSEHDLFIFVTELRFFQDDKIVYSQIRSELKKPCFLVRNKFDLVLADAAYDGHNLTEAESKAAIENNIRENLAPLDVQKVYMVSARHPAHFDLPTLLKDIQDSFDGMKRLRLENDLAAWSKEALLRKRENAMRITAWYAGMAALNGLNPVVGLDVTVDVGILRRLSREVAEIYSLTKEQEEYWRTLLKGPDGRAVLQKTVALTLKYGTESAIVGILKAIGKREVPKTFAKFIPFAGQALAVAAGAGLTYTFGKKLVDEYHEMAEEILADLNS